MSSHRKELNCSVCDYRSYIDGILDDMEKAETVGNTREITRLIKVLGGKTKQTSPRPCAKAATPCIRVFSEKGTCNAKHRTTQSVRRAFKTTIGH